MNNIDKIIELLRSGVKISNALKEVYDNPKIYIPFNDEDFDISLEELNLSMRSCNALRRSNFNTLNDVINHFAEKGWNSIKNFGKTSATEVFEKIINVAWNKMNKFQKAEFLMNIEETFE